MAKRPPCPDPDLFVWVHTVDGGYWRRKRGTIKKASLNAAFAQNASLTAVTNQAGKRIVGKLSPYLDRLAIGRTFSTLTGALKKGYNAAGRTSYRYLKDLDMQPKYRLDRLLKPVYTVEQMSEAVRVKIPIDGATIDHTGGLVSHYYFELVILQGDAGADDELRIDCDTSAVYPIGSGGITECVLQVDVIKKPWMVFLKLNTIESPTVNTMELAASGSNYGMKVVAVGD
jgi:hypothetical protein